MGLDVSANLIVGFPVDGIKFWEKKEFEEQTCNIRQEKSSDATGRAHYTKNLKANFCEVCGSKLRRVIVAEPTEGYIKLCKELEPDSTPESNWEWWMENDDDGVGLWASEQSEYDNRDLFGIKIGSTGSHRSPGGGVEFYKPELDKVFKRMESYHKTLKASGTIRLCVVLNAG
jgi:hypothetical protein